MLDNFVMIKWITTIDYPFPSTRLIDIVISTQTKKKIHCPSVSLTKWRLRTIQLTLTVCEHNGGMMFNRTSGSLLNTPSLQCVLFCAGRQSVNLMKRVIFLWLSVTK